MKLKPLLAGALLALLVACNQTTTTANANPTSLHSIVTEKAREHGVPPKLAHGIVKVESGYRCNAKNPSSSATGAMQVLRGTAKGVGVYGNLRDCRTGVEAGMRYLKLALDRAKGNWCGAATLYNRGVYASPVSSGYCRKVLASAG